MLFVNLGCFVHCIKSPYCRCILLCRSRFLMKLIQTLVHHGPGMETKILSSHMLFWRTAYQMTWPLSKSWQISDAFMYIWKNLGNKIGHITPLYYECSLCFLIHFYWSLQDGQIQLCISCFSANSNWIHRSLLLNSDTADVLKYVGVDWVIMGNFANQWAGMLYGSVGYLYYFCINMMNYLFLSI